jgi:hypothetical protein
LWRGRWNARPRDIDECACATDETAEIGGVSGIGEPAPEQLAASFTGPPNGPSLKTTFILKEWGNPLRSFKK